MPSLFQLGAAVKPVSLLVSALLNLEKENSGTTMFTSKLYGQALQSRAFALSATWISVGKTSPNLASCGCPKAK